MAGTLARRGRAHGAAETAVEKVPHSYQEGGEGTPITTHTRNDLLPNRLCMVQEEDRSADCPQSQRKLGAILFYHKYNQKKGFTDGGKIEKRKKKEKGQQKH